MGFRIMRSVGLYSLEHQARRLVEGARRRNPVLRVVYDFVQEDMSEDRESPVKCHGLAVQIRGSGKISIQNQL